MPRSDRKKKACPESQEGWTFYGDEMKDALGIDDAGAIGAWLDEGNSTDARHEIIGRCKCATPLIVAASFEGSEQIVKLLVRKGVDVNACSSRSHGGLCAIKGAVCSNSPAILQLLLEHGAKDQPTDDGHTAEEMAEMIAAPADMLPPHSKGDPRCINLLRQYEKKRREEERRRAEPIVTVAQPQKQAQPAAATSSAAVAAVDALEKAARAADEREAKAAENLTVSPHHQTTTHAHTHARACAHTRGAHAPPLASTAAPLTLSGLSSRLS
jgi:hypothetical protein